jgi:hypothetical protein
MTRTRRLVLLGVTLLALTSCSNQPASALPQDQATSAPVAAATSARPTPSPSPTSSPSPTAAPVSVPKTFTTPRAVVDMLTRLGAPCTGYTDTEVGGPFAPHGLLKGGTCNGGTGEVSVGIFRSHADAWGDFDYSTALLGDGIPVHMAIGGNWVLNGDDAAFIERAATLLAGEYRTT